MKKINLLILSKNEMLKIKGGLSCPCGCECSCTVCKCSLPTNSVTGIVTGHQAVEYSILGHQKDTTTA